MLRSKQENSQNSPLNNPKTAPAPQSPQEIEGFEDDELDEDDETEEIEEETPQPIAKPVSKPTAEEIQQMQIAQVMQEIELLQNNGRFRVELLHQLQELNSALSVIAGLIGTIVEAKDGQENRN